jgi:signal transduction histidine kinase
VQTDLQKDVDAIGRIPAVPTILEVLARVTGMRFVAVARVTGERWVTCSALDRIGFGLTPGDELQVETTICHEIEESGQAVIIDDVEQDGIYCNHPTPKMYGFRSYISVPIIRADGAFFGTLCAIDPLPATLKDETTAGMFTLFADLIASHLDGQEKLATSEAELANARELAHLREQFIAVLGHDLRNPLASIDAGVSMLAKRSLDDRARNIVGLMRGSVVRMGGIIDNVLDLARARLGGGLSLSRDADVPIEETLRQVVDELRSIRPDARVEVDLTIDRPVPCDRSRVGQLLSNLLGNALTHGAEDRPIMVEARTDDGGFELSVRNHGAPIPDTAMGNLFQPFFRADTRPSQQGLGLGLYIASQIAEAHDGTLDAASTPDETRFTFRMPI